MSLTEQLFSFEGRLRRRDYWISSIILWIAVFAATSCVLGLFGAFTGTFFGAKAALQPAAAHALLPGSIVAVLLVLGIMLIALWPSLAIGVKRCHDRDKSGWWLLLWFVLMMIPFLGILAWAWQIIELGFIDGTQGGNRFGPSPKGIDSSRLGSVFE